MEPSTLARLTTSAAERWPDRTAVSTPAGSMTFGELGARAHGVADRLAGLGVRPGDRVAVLMPNSVDAVAAILGATLAGAVPVPVNTRNRSTELRHVLGHSDAVCLVTQTSRSVNGTSGAVDYIARLVETYPELDGSGPALSLTDAPSLRVVLAFGDQPPGWALPAPEWTTVPAGTHNPAGLEARSDDAAVMIYTSGTTALPKGCVISHRALISTAFAGAIDRIGVGHDEVIWNPAPLCHVSAYVSLLACLATGGQYVTGSHFDVEIVAPHLVDTGVTIAYANFPAFYYALGEWLSRTGNKLDRLHTLTTAAAPAEIERIRSLFPETLQISVTGSTELSGTICANHRSDTPDHRAETAGPPIDGVQISIRDLETRETVPTGTTGEMWVSGNCLFDRYHKQPESPFVVEDGITWFPTGDLAVLDAEGRCAFRGRIKDMLKVGGENVAAAEVENFLLTHPDVVIAQVIGVPDDRLGEVPFAFVELKPGSTTQPEEIIDYCKGKIAAYKVPRGVQLMSEWPTSATKIQKAKLRELIAN